MNPDDHNLLLTAVDIFSGKQPHRNVGKWEYINSGVFVTAYFQMPPISENVWCCMSNGEYDGSQSVLHNTLDSAKICATLDTRRFKAHNPAIFEVTILVPRSKWRLVHKLSNGQWDISRNHKQAIHAQIGNHSGVYLPNVWNEHPEWDSLTLIQSLVKKVGDTGEPIIHEIGIYNISDTGSF